ncbi:flagellar basal body P-ring formation chaperone FlgA [Paraburkholderia sartisoli]|uniref:Flagella basal body P-ring formation protein FlgA n=1 Tax=Paraburkholderia sartisoli TaxID=83784 RepID=A0A1H4G3T3_9BURK|nr:flagellar basal body P-ring formation chaperone FlgA [Paraburkholderia sartisoli]SEB04077.1 flagella basal body P-ring formation protein FlgA [Paraburkholderia sartisoli]
MSLPASVLPHTARRAGARTARTLAAWLVLAVGAAGVALPSSASAEDAGGPIVIAGPAETNPGALAAMAERMDAPVPTAAAQRAAMGATRTPAGLASSNDGNNTDRFASAAHADGAIVIPGAGEAPAATPAQGMMRVSMQPATREVMPVVVTPAQPAAVRMAAPAQPVTVNPPAGNAAAGFDTLASRGEPPQLGAGTGNATRAVGAYTAARGVPASQPKTQAAAPQVVQPVQASQAAQAAPPVPAGQQDGEVVRRAALAFLQQQVVGLPGKVEITIAPVFPRGLAACTTLEPFMPTGTRLWGRTTVGVRCAGARPWTMYMQARITVHGTYYVASRPMNPGETLSAADLVAREGDLTMLPQAVVTDPSQAVGSATTMRVSAGLPLRLDMLKSASSVTIGQTVKVVAQGQGFAISAEGSAMNNAAPGQPVRVKTSSGQVIQGIVKNGGTVEIQL